MQKRRPTVLDVAKTAGVSPSTVSRCLRGGPHVREEVRTRILQAVEELGYEPNLVAQSLRGGRTHSIGVVFPQITNAFFSQCVQHIEKEAAERGYSVVLLTHGEDAKRQAQQLAVVRRSRLDGIILTVAPHSDLDAMESALSGIPVIALDRPLWEGVDAVLLQHRQAAAMATEHLLGHGHTEIMSITVNPSIYSFSERIEQFEETMRSAGATPRTLSAQSYAELPEVIQGALQRWPNVTALLPLSNMATFAVVEALRGMDRYLPFIGFDDPDFATIVDPPITVVRQRTDQLARHAVRLLFQHMGSETHREAEIIALPADLVRRKSCGCHES